ncbi:hypothetical protein D3C71_1382450 [compost metagenome]
MNAASVLFQDVTLYRSQTFHSSFLGFDPLVSLYVSRHSAPLDHIPRRGLYHGHIHSAWLSRHSIAFDKRLVGVIHRQIVVQTSARFSTADSALRASALNDLDARLIEVLPEGCEVQLEVLAVPMADAPLFF